MENVLTREQIEDARDGRAVTRVALLIALQHHQTVGQLLNVCRQWRKKPHYLPTLLHAHSHKSITHTPSFKWGFVNGDCI